MGQRFVLVQTDVDLTLSESEFLAEASKLLEYFFVLYHNNPVSLHNLHHHLEYLKTMTDSPDCHLDFFVSKIVFDEKDEERPPWNLCGSSERSLIFQSINIFLLFAAITNSLSFLFIKKFSTERPAIRSVPAFSLGYLIPTPKWTK